MRKQDYDGTHLVQHSESQCKVMESSEFIVTFHHFTSMFLRTS